MPHFNTRFKELMLKCGETVPGDTALLPVAPQEGVVVYPGSTVQEDITNPCACTHCGTPCDGELAIRAEGRAFCCAGCKLVFELLAENGLGHFYDLQKTPGSRIRSVPTPDQFTYLDEPEVRRHLLNFSDGATARVLFHIPAIHCIACIWLLENLFRLDPAIGSVRVNFPRKEATVCFAEEKLKLSELVRLLASIGYAPALHLADLDQHPSNSAHRLFLRLGVAGFTFGNIMLLSFPGYLGLDAATGADFKWLFGILNLVLALPVLLYSASDYWRAAWMALHRCTLSIDVPIALGLVAFYAQSGFEILTGHGEGYLDSFAGLVFFLLCGRVFQQKTFERLSFERDYKSFFPLSVVRRTDAGEETVALSQLRVGDRLVLRHRELIPADARLVSGPANIDYSFVTGESQPTPRAPGDHVHAGGQQLGGSIELELVKPVSQSYLTSLWAHEAFRKHRDSNLNSLTNTFSRRFTWMVLAIAVGSAAFWAVADAERAVKSFVSVLIVACPCALALAAPFALGTAQRLLARRNIFLKDQLVLETLARVDAVVFDKTGTLTESGSAAARFLGSPMTLREKCCVYSVTRQSTHPHSLQIAELLSDSTIQHVEDFAEVAGQGLRGRVQGMEVRLGSREWVKGEAISNTASPPQTPSGSEVWISIDGKLLGIFDLNPRLRPEIPGLAGQLQAEHHLALLSGDNARAREEYQKLFGERADLRFNYSPLEKLEFVRQWQQAGRKVLMMGDGLNDAGALKQSDVGVAVVERIGAFSPASDVIMEAGQVAGLARLLAFARKTVTVVRLSFIVSSLYNLIGLSIAAQGLLSPVVCAILMPLSSATVVGMACGLTHWHSRRLYTRRADQHAASNASAHGPQVPCPVSDSQNPSPLAA